MVALLATALGLGLLSTTYVWPAIPTYFATFETYRYGRSFGEREAIRLFACLVVALPATLCLGGLYSVGMSIAMGDRARRTERVGIAGALNTVGNIVGALGCGVLLPQLGSLRTLHVLVSVALMLSVSAVVGLAGRARWWGIAAVLGTAGVFVLQPGRLDLDRIATGANVYFARRAWGKVIDWAESRDGGLLTVHESEGPATLVTRTLLGNGKFEGNDTGEVPAQLSFALVPAVHTERRNRALIVGYGTGSSARVLVDAGFVHVDVTELSADVIRLANKHFAHLNRAITSRPDVGVHITDGRNFMLLNRDEYDLITVEISAIWFRGAGSLYNQEFYELTRARLAPGGVFQQWAQLHHILLPDIVSILATIRSVFPEVSLYSLGGQGIVIACPTRCPVRPDAIAQLGARAEMAPIFAAGASIDAIDDSRVLSPRDVDRLLESAASQWGSLENLTSTDENMYLEYSTPRGNATKLTSEDTVRELVTLARSRSLPPTH